MDRDLTVKLACYCGANRNDINNAILKSKNNNEGTTNAIDKRPEQTHYCKLCAIQLLSSKISHYHSSRDRRERAKDECNSRLSNTRQRYSSAHAATLDNRFVHHLSNDHNRTNNETPLLSLPDVNYLHHQSLLLHKRLELIRSQTNSAALQLTAKTMENDSRQDELQTISLRITSVKHRLDQMYSCLLMPSDEERTYDISKEEVEWKPRGGGFKDALQSNTREIQLLRFRMACKVFDMHRLDIGEQQQYQQQRRRPQLQQPHEKMTVASGVGKISSLPLPHAGPVLYSVIPPEVLSSSLRLVASLTQLVSCCLGVVLPHPILVYSMECMVCGCVYDGYGGDIIHDDDDDDDVDNIIHIDGGHNKQQGRHCKNVCKSCQNNESSSNNKTPLTNTSRPSEETIPSSSSLFSALSSPSTSTSTSSITHTKSNKSSSFLTLMGSSARKAMTLTSAVTTRVMSHVQHHQQEQHKHSSSVDDIHLSYKALKCIDPLSPAIIKRRMYFTSYAHLRENHDALATEYVLNPPRWRENEVGSDSSKKRSDDNVDTIESPDEEGIVTVDRTTFTTSIDQSSNASAKTITTTGVITEPTLTSSYITREEFRVAEDRFATGLQLLQNDIVALCFRVGVDVSTLWPAESMLLNLHALRCHCQRMIAEGGMSGGKDQTVM